MTRPGWRIGVDIGGTFTDLVLAGPSGEIRVSKVPTTVADPSGGVLDALAKAAAGEGLEIGALLEGCVLFVHGSTIATNTVLEGKGARVGMLTTEGFRDSLEIRRGARDDPWDHRTPYPPVLVPRYLRRGVGGRIDAAGGEARALILDDVDRACDLFGAEGVESVAICLFNSFLNPDHERRAAARVAERRPLSPISISSEIAPVMGEYERGSTAVLNAYVAPRALTYLRALGARLEGLGLRIPLLLIQSNGGAVSIAELGDRPVGLLLSGPAAGVGALRYYRDAIGADTVVSMEIGGTSCDVILMDRGEVAFTDLLDIGGYRCISPSIEINTIGAGGGTIARVDGAGLLEVGPQGAGAHPGPACYGKGGALPTITDAHVVLGRLQSGPYADGAVTIDGDRAAAAIRERIAVPLGLSLERAAAGVILLMEQKLLHAVERVSTERGHDPRRLTLVAAGGAGPLHAVAVGRALGCARVYVPRLSGAFCALGMLHADVRHDYVQMHLSTLERASGSELAAIFGGLEGRAAATLAREGFAGERVRLVRALDLRYVGQQWDITVGAAAPFDRDAVRRDFAREHQRLFGHTQPDGVIEITKLRVGGIGIIARLAPEIRNPARASAQAASRRPIWIDARTGWCESPVYRGAELAPGHAILGPAIVDEQTTTLLIAGGDRLVVDPGGNYSIELAG